MRSRNSPAQSLLFPGSQRRNQELQPLTGELVPNAAVWLSRVDGESCPRRCASPVGLKARVIFPPGFSCAF